MANLYLLKWTTPPVDSGRSYWEGAVVAAETPEEAETIHPDGISNEVFAKGGIYRSSSEWPNDLSEIEITYLGTTFQDLSGVILSSFIHP